MLFPIARWFVVALVATGSCTVIYADDAVHEELKRHQGIWMVTSSTFDGHQAPKEIAGTIRRVVVDDHVVWERNGKRFAGTKIELDATRDPHTINVIPDGGKNRGERVLGIYKLESDRLTICMAAPGQRRPNEFNAEKGSGWTLQTFQRAPSLCKR